MKAIVRQLGLWMVLVLAAPAFAGQIVDRIVASVDNVPILQSDLEQAVRFEALQQNRAANSFNSEERRSVLERLVDQQLIHEQMGDEAIAEAEDRDVNKQVDQLRAAYPQAQNDDGWKQLLANYGLDETVVRDKIAHQLQMMKFVELRLRPETRIAREDVERYYMKTLVPQVEQQGQKAETLANVYPKIVEILRAQKIDQMLVNWLHDLRDHSEIRWMEAKAETTEGTASGGM